MNLADLLSGRVVRGRTLDLFQHVRHKFAPFVRYSYFPLRRRPVRARVGVLTTLSAAEARQRHAEKRRSNAFFSNAFGIAAGG
jgi:hypothetical protein